MFLFNNPNIIKEMKTIIDADGHILGRLATYVAKRALLGDEIIVVNAEKAIISGRKEMVFRQHLDKLKIRNKGNYRKGPFHQKRPDKFVRRAIRGMLNHREYRGRQAFERVMVYISVPEGEIEKKHGIKVKDVQKLDDLKKRVDNFVTVGDVCRFIGGKWTGS